METNFEPGRVFANERDFQDQLDTWFVKANARQHRSIRARPIDRLAEELDIMAALPAAPPDTDRRWVQRIGPDPYVRFDTCDYSLNPEMVGRRVEIRVGWRRWDGWTRASKSHDRRNGDVSNADRPRNAARLSQRRGRALGRRRRWRRERARVLR